MTDITELALLVSKAKASVFTLEYISQFEPADIDSDDVDLRFEVDGRDTGTNVSIVDECGQAAKVIGALVEALEKARGMESYWKTQCRGITDHCEELQARIAELESRTVTPVTYSENADADRCRKWAWEQVKAEVSTEDWTTGDNITYFGFFCWGWDMRRQYNEQRPVTVKLPKPHAHLIWIQAGHAPDDFWDDVAVSHSEKDRCCDGSERYPVYARWEIEEMLAATGIKVEAE
ncbi:TPA: hypothetical protein ACTXAG_003164 [Klebsiella oxytoca]